MFDSILYGNGMTLFAFHQMKNLIDDSNYSKKYLDFNSFFEDILYANEHKRVYRKFLQYFDDYEQKKDLHQEIRDYFKTQLPYLKEAGFENWASKNLLEIRKEFGSKVTVYIQLLYNYWFHVIHIDILSNKEVKLYLENLSSEISHIVRDKKHIFTTNFDTLLDYWIKPQHLHGKFIVPLDSFNSIIKLYTNNKEFDYTFLFGAGYVEKINRLESDNEINMDTFDLDFFRNQNINLGHLLIFGISFTKAAIVPDEYLQKKEDFKSTLFQYIDGHLLRKLKMHFEAKRLERITITYYNADEKDYLSNVFKEAELFDIVEIVKSDSIPFVGSGN